MTGYTAEIEKGICFKKFALQCAKAFDVCITMRDDPSDTPIPQEFEPSNYHSCELKKVNKLLLHIKGMNNKQCEFKAKEANKKEIQYHKKQISKINSLKSKYEKMLNDITNWNPPTSDHVGLKDFMYQQVSDSLKFDCNIEYHQAALKTANDNFSKDGKIWRENQIKNLEKDIEYHQKENAEEIKQVNSRNKWIKELRESLI